MDRDERKHQQIVQRDAELMEYPLAKLERKHQQIVQRDAELMEYPLAKLYKWKPPTRQALPRPDD